MIEGAAAVGAEPAARLGAAERGDLRRAASAFEALFVQMFLRSMREAQLTEGFFGGETGADVYEGILDDHLSGAVSGGSPFGIARLLEQQWAGLDEPTRAASQAIRKLQDLRARQAYAPTARLEVPAGAPQAAPPVSSRFGWRRDPFDGTTRFHGGIDLPAAEGTPIVSPAPGRVVAVRRAGGYGLHVEIAHEGGWRTRYAHLASSDVRAGQTVGRGSPVGRVGRTGRATGPHLHLEVLRDGVRIDPARQGLPAWTAQVLARQTDETSRGGHHHGPSGADADEDR